MARKPMVTRTIITTKVIVLCLDVNSAEPFNETVTLPRTYKDDNKLLKTVEEVINTDTVKAVHIVDKKEIECNFAFLNNRITETAKELRCYVDATFVPGKLVMPLSSICPPAQAATTTATMSLTSTPSSSTRPRHFRPAKSATLSSTRQRRFSSAENNLTGDPMIL